MYHLTNIAYIVLLLSVPVLTFMIWTIIGRPRIAKPKQWTIHPDADKLLECEEIERKSPRGLQQDVAVINTVGRS